MKTLASLLLIGCSALPWQATAQSGVLAGQTAGMHHVAGPNSYQFACAPGSGTSICLELDVDADSRNDVSLVHAQLSTSGGGGVVYYEVRSLRPEVELAGADSATWMGSRQGNALPLAAGDDLNIAPRPVGRYPAWRQGTATTPTAVTISFSQAILGSPSRHIGYWTDNTSRHYVAARIGSATSGYRYGWLLVVGRARVEAFAMQTVVSATRPAHLASIHLMPNPATSEVFLDLPSNTPAQLVIRDLAGRVLRQQDLGSAQHSTVSLTGLAAGVYFFQISTPDGSVTRRVVKA